MFQSDSEYNLCALCADVKYTHSLTCIQVTHVSEWRGVYTMCLGIDAEYTHITTYKYYRCHVPKWLRGTPCILKVNLECAHSLKYALVPISQWVCSMDFAYSIVDWECVCSFCRKAAIKPARFIRGCQEFVFMY